MMDDAGFAPPPFRAADALVALKRQLRDLRPLTERGSRYEIKGRPVLELSLQGDAIEARLARRASAAPQWEPLQIRSSLDQRRFIDQIRQRLRQWESDE